MFLTFEIIVSGWHSGEYKLFDACATWEIIFSQFVKFPETQEASFSQLLQVAEHPEEEHACFHPTTLPASWGAALCPMPVSAPS